VERDTTGQQPLLVVRAKRASQQFSTQQILEVILCIFLPVTKNIDFSYLQQNIDFFSFICNNGIFFLLAPRRVHPWRPRDGRE
jgi:hypothetical protein